MAAIPETIRPASTEELSAAIQAATREGYNASASRRVEPAEGVCTIDLNNMQATVDYPARDMTITVQAGMGVSELRNILKQEAQQLPVLPPLQAWVQRIVVSLELLRGKLEELARDVVRQHVAFGVDVVGY